MKFLHTADWHIGRKLNGFSLLEEQKDVFEKMLTIAVTQQVDAIVVAGDLYDRSMPSVEAVELLNAMMIEMNLEKKFPVLAISGNHDSATRLSTGSPWLEKEQFYLYTQLEQAFSPVVIGDTQFFLLPYIEPIHARLYFDDETLVTIPLAMEKIMEEVKPLFLPDKHHVLISHFFVTGALKGESETPLEVGGLSSVSTDMFEVFDYVALGHLHYKDAIGQHEKIKYSGSLLKYSLSERNQEKGVRIVTLDETSVSSEFIPITPLRDVSLLREKFTTLVDYDYYQTINREDYIAIELTDKTSIPNALSELRQIYPRLISLERVGEGKVVSDERYEAIEIKQVSPKELITNYFEDVTEEPLTEQQSRWLEDTMIEVRKEK
ncbi:exonuclease SbcCD subunit D [Vagococcus luciliae]|uniref:Nuclease SbcCD subunit D n=1 Tax=Vagococcus luciliae TaxID=2920380 RepID=A0ABY5NXC3_9ENTE|nr:exonuclease SbcCD subunit D [Vagococcus luciliae]UUV98232.1 Nuclease SbcCD subunit D [Vagococcus luciliae]